MENNYETIKSKFVRKCVHQKTITKRLPFVNGVEYINRLVMREWDRG